MGCNYYTISRSKKIHLGKSSVGWRFTFQYNGGKYYKNISQMKNWLKGKTIFDEYGEKISHNAFWQLVKNKQKEQFVHALEHPSQTDFMVGNYSFTDCKFS